jgi:hypothetical protein
MGRSVPQTNHPQTDFFLDFVSLPGHFFRIVLCESRTFCTKGKAMIPRSENIDTILCHAVEIESPDDRQKYLDEACAGDVEIRQQIEQLIHNHFNAGSFLEAPAAAVATIDMPPVTETVGSVIGPYKLMEQIGEGGMGVVYVAQQVKPVRRKVALKIIKPGMDTKQVITRFEAERQALALMDHPNIAKVLDAGTTS